mgnify:CR=1 FL=1
MAKDTILLSSLLVVLRLSDKGTRFSLGIYLVRGRCNRSSSSRNNCRYHLVRRSSAFFERFGEEEDFGTEKFHLNGAYFAECIDHF